MGGTKKKSLGASEKGQKESPQEAAAGKKEEKEKSKGPRPKTKISVILDEKQGLNALPGLKALTPQALAKTLGVKISIANMFIRSLEAQGTVRRVGGYSGHHVYELVKK